MSASKVDHLIVNAAEVVTCAGHSDRPARGPAQGSLRILEDGAVAVGGGRILAVGDARSLRRDLAVDDDAILDARRGVVMPGFVDAHTHLVFGGDRAAEWEGRMAGKPYLEILREGGGILSTVRATRAATFDDLLDRARTWAGRCLRHGTTTVEIKSGYCLDREGEIRTLEVARALDGEGPPRVVPTYLGAHVVPEEHARRRSDYVDLVVSLLGEIRARRLAEFVDAFCETEAFTLAECERVLQRASDLGFGVKLHAEQFSHRGAAALGARLGAVSVDHLEHVGDDDIRTLASADRPPIGVLLPAVPFHLGMSEHAPARRLIAGGVPIALATDLNPGSSFTPSLPMVIALACRMLGMSVAESIVGVTINAAHAVGLAGETGSLEPGKRADLVVCDVPDHRWLGYAFGWNPVRVVLAEGQVVQ